MKKLLFIALLAAGAWQLHGTWSAADGAFDANGNPLVRVFVGPGCNKPCEDLKRTIRRRGIPFDVVDVSSPEGRSHGVDTYPLTVAGDRRVAGSSTMEVVGLLAEVYGEEVLTAAERRAMRGHFDAAGNPRVVLYGTAWCGFCKRQRALFRDEGIAFVDIDVEASAQGKAAYDALRGFGYPLVYVGYRRFQGYRERDLLAAIDELVP